MVVAGTTTSDLSMIRKEISGNESGMATETSIPQPASVGMLRGLSLGKLNLGCLPRMEAILAKNVFLGY